MFRVQFTPPQGPGQGCWTPAQGARPDCMGTEGGLFRRHRAQPGLGQSVPVQKQGRARLGSLPGAKSGRNPSCQAPQAAAEADVLLLVPRSQ